MLKPRLIGTIALILFIFVAINAYIGWNGWLYLSALTSLDNPLPYAIAVAIISISYIIGRLLQPVAPLRKIGRVFKLIGSYWLAVMEYAVLLLPPANLIYWLLTKLGISASAALLAVGSVVAVIMLAILLRGSWNAWSPVVRTYSITIAKPAGSRTSLRIGMASDIHLGTIVGKRHLARLAKAMEHMKPDLILLPGDIIDDDIAPYLDENMSEVMKRLRAPLGVYAVLGNHEYYGGHIARFIAEMDAVGIRVLLDESVKMDDGFYIIGRKDLTAKRSDPEGRQSVKELVAALDASLPLIMMDHQPSDLEQASLQGIDLSLSGHTHRGQMMPNHLFTRRLFELDWGFLQKGQLHAIVSSGFGTWGPPLRIGSRAEIIQLNVEFRP
ncbi:metallophosphoesterase [Paenibacillus algorifonticola]|uniref:metallophosphoesterase n=1 Tax=Paenibacillus algorifonticola TaxID=684063 RepID=UPI003D29E969